MRFLGADRIRSLPNALKVCAFRCVIPLSLEGDDGKAPMPERIAGTTAHNSLTSRSHATPHRAVSLALDERRGDASHPRCRLADDNRKEEQIP